MNSPHELLPPDPPDASQLPRQLSSSDISMNTPMTPRSILAAIVLLTVRGVLLWLVVPLVAITWIGLGVWLRRRRISFGKLLGWADMNLIAGLQRSVLRPMFPAPPPWIPLIEISDVRHRTDVTDLL